MTFQAAGKALGKQTHIDLIPDVQWFPDWIFPIFTFVSRTQPNRTPFFSSDIMNCSLKHHTFGTTFPVLLLSS